MFALGSRRATCTPKKSKQNEAHAVWVARLQPEPKTMNKFFL